MFLIRTLTKSKPQQQLVDDFDSRRSAKALDEALEHKFSSSSLIEVLEPRLGQRNAEQCSVAVLHCLLTNVTVFEDWFTVLNRLLAIEVWFVSMVAESVLRHLIRAASPLRT